MNLDIILMGEYMKNLKGILFYIFCVIGIFIVFKICVFYITFLLGFFISQILEPIIKKSMEKFKLSRKKASIVLVFIFFILLISILLLGGTFIISEISNLLSNFNEYINSITDTINMFSGYIDIDKLNLNPEIKNIFEETSMDIVNTFATGIKSYLTNFLTLLTSIPKIFIYVIITILATYFISSDKFYILDQMEYHFPKRIIGKIRDITNKITNSLGLYLKAEIILIFISFIIVLIGLSIFYFLKMNVKYPLLLAVIIGFVDSLPILRKWNSYCALGSNMFCKQ